CVRGECLSEVQQRLRLEHLAAADREQDTEHTACDETRDNQLASPHDALPRRAQVDLALGVEVGHGPLAHRAATLPATQFHCAATPVANGVCGSQPSSALAFVTSAPVRRTSPTAASCRSRRSCLPEISSAREKTSL